MKQRWIEAAAVEINGIGPLAIDAWTGDKIVVEIAHRRAACAGHAGPAEAFHFCVDEPKQSLPMTQARRPDAAGIGIAEHVELARAIQWPREQAPVHEIPRVMNLHAGKPFEG